MRRSGRRGGGWERGLGLPHTRARPRRTKALCSLPPDSGGAPGPLRSSPLRWGSPRPGPSALRRLGGSGGPGAEGGERALTGRAGAASRGALPTAAGRAGPVAPGGRLSRRSGARGAGSGGRRPRREGRLKVGLLRAAAAPRGRRVRWPP